MPLNLLKWSSGRRGARETVVTDSTSEIYRRVIRAADFETPMGPDTNPYCMFRRG